MDKKRLISYSLILSLLIVPSLVNLAGAQEEPEFLFTLYFVVHSTDTTGLAIANALKAELATIGIGLVVETMESQALMEFIYSGEILKGHDGGGADIYMGGSYWMATDYLWYIGCFNSYSTVPACWNEHGWNNGEADTLLENAMSEWELEKRKEYMYEWQEVWYEDQPCYVLWESANADARIKALKGLNPGLFNYDVNEWTVDGFTEEDDVTIRLAKRSDLRGLNPFYLNGGPAVLDMVNRNLFFVNQDENGVWYQKEDLAESVEQSEDGKTITFHLRDDVLWHDGVPFTAEDVLFSWEAIIDRDTGSQFRGDFITIVPSMDIVENPDPYTIILNLETPLSLMYVKTLFGSTFGMPVPKHILKDVPHAEWRTHETNTDIGLPGLGPYKFVRKVSDEFIELEAFDDFYRGRPFIDHIIFEIIDTPTAAIGALESGEIDAIRYYSFSQLIIDKDRIEENPELEVITWNAITTPWINFNNRHPILNNPNVRKAISYMVPIDHIFEDLYFGYGERASTPVNSDTWGWNPNIPYPEYNPEKAREHLTLAGYPSWPPEVAETETEPTSIVPMAGALIAGLIIGAAASYVLFKKKAI